MLHIFSHYNFCCYLHAPHTHARKYIIDVLFSPCIPPFIRQREQNIAYKANEEDVMKMPTDLSWKNVNIDHSVKGKGVIKEKARQVGKYSLENRNEERCNQVVCLFISMEE